MHLFDKLRDNKGTVSSALGKTLAAEVLAGNLGMLDEAVKLASYDLDNEKSKNIRAGAGKIIEIVAEKSPRLVAPYMTDLLPALTAKEPQTRWMVIMAFSYCAQENEVVAKEAISYAKRYIMEKEGLCIASSADLYLGSYGALSRQNTVEILPLLLEAMSTCIKNEQDWIIESLIRIAPNLSGEEIDQVMPFLMSYHDDVRKATAKRVKKFMKIIE